jgi:hypothetical protein
VPILNLSEILYSNVKEHHHQQQLQQREVQGEQHQLQQEQEQPVIDNLKFNQIAAEIKEVLN